MAIRIGHSPGLPERKEAQSGMIVTWSVAAASAAFIALAAGSLIFLRAMLHRISRMQAAAETMERELQALAADVRGAVVPAGQTFAAVKQQVERTAKLFEAVERFGDSANQVAGAVHRVSSVLADSAARHAERAAGQYREAIGNAMDWAELGLTAWQLLQSQRESAGMRSRVSQRRGEGHDKNERSV